MSFLKFSLKKRKKIRGPWIVLWLSMVPLGASVDISQNNRKVFGDIQLSNNAFLEMWSSNMSNMA